MQSSADSESGRSRFLLSSAGLTFALGASWALTRTARRRSPFPFFKSNVAIDPSFSPVLHAAKALGVGTLLCLGTATLLIGLGSLTLDIYDLPTFSTRMRTLLGKRDLTRVNQHELRALHDGHNAPRQSLEDLHAAVEWDEMWREGRQIDAERAELKRIKKQSKSQSKLQTQSAKDSDAKD